MLKSQNLGKVFVWEVGSEDWWDVTVPAQGEGVVLGIGMCLECGGGPGNSWEVTEDHSEPASVTANLHLEM